MTYKTLKLMLSANANETPELRARHYYIKLPSGRWCRTLDAPPHGAVHVRGRIYRMVSQ